jgi:hypothetical protein
MAPLFAVRRVATFSSVLVLLLLSLVSALVIFIELIK